MGEDEGQRIEGGTAIVVGTGEDFVFEAAFHAFSLGAGRIENLRDGAEAISRLRRDESPSLAIVLCEDEDCMLLPLTRQLRTRGVELVWIVANLHNAAGGSAGGGLFRLASDPSDVVRLAVPY